MAGIGWQFFGAGLGTACNELVSISKNVLHNGGPRKRVKDVLEKIIPILDECHPSEEERMTEHSRKQLEEFRQKMKGAYERIKKSPQLSLTPFSISNIGQSIEDMMEMLGLEDDLKYFSQTQAWILIMSEIRNIRKLLSETERMTGEDRVRPRVSELPKHQVGLKESLDKLKSMVFGESDRTVAVSAMGGCGKTTLAYALCTDPQVKEHFKDIIIFETVSQSPNIKGILESMWKKITKQPVPDFKRIKDAHEQLKLWICEKAPQPILVVLDDVWSTHDLNDLLIKAEGCQTVFTSRRKFRRFDTYELPLLREKDALSLFCWWAFEKQSIPVEGHEKALAEQIVAKCQGLPLALEVMGRSLYEQPPEIWQCVHRRLSQPESIFENDEESLLNCMAMSIEVLDDDMKQCFLDLGLFPEKSKISVDSLLNIWVYVHNLEWEEAFLILHKLEQQNLLNLVADIGNYPGAFHGITCGLYVVQHDVLRNLAIYMAKQHSPNKCKRLIMHTKKDFIPKSWQKHTDAEIITIHTGSMKDTHWHKMDFPKARALILIFAADEYVIPSFLRRMLELKVLIIINQNSIRAKIQDMSSFNSLAQLKSICLERLVIPSLEKCPQSLENLEKISLFLCKGDDEDSKHGLGLEFFCSHLSRLVEITIDHCTDFKELPTCVCNIPTLQKLSITNCHDLQKLSDNLGELGSLEVLFLQACPSLETLPESVCTLRELKFLDISQCVCIRKLPDKFGELCSLVELDMRECANVKNLPKSVNKLKSLCQVTCDDKVEHKWLKIKDSTISQLKVRKAEQQFNLDWLHY